MDTKEKEPPDNKSRDYFRKFSTFILGNIEDGFSMLGLKIGKYPIHFMLGCFVVVGLCGLGFLAFTSESNQEKLWLPEGHRVRENSDWITANIDKKTSNERMLFVTDNVLKASKIQALFSVYEGSLALQTSTGIQFQDVCEKAGSRCLVTGILEIWSFDSTTISALTDAQVLLDIKNTKTSPVYGNDIELGNYLSGITYDNAGDVIAAQVAVLNWMAIYSDAIRETTETWEDVFIDFGLSDHSEFSSTYVIAGKSVEDENERAQASGVSTLTAGYCLVIVFAVSTLGKFNFIEQRIWLTLAGMLSVGLSILVSYGLSAALQQPYGPVQAVLPFLLLGLGVDDMFVIVGALSNLTPEEQAYSPALKLSTVLRHAGVAITVTSLTDFVAFAIGATTVIPTLRSFGIAASIGIVSLYLLQVVFFGACLFFDISRIEQYRDGCFFFKHKDTYTPNSFSQKQFVPYVFKKGLARLSVQLWFRIVVIIAFFALLGTNIYSFTQLKTHLDVLAFLPRDSYVYKFSIADDKYFPNKGIYGNIYCKTIDYFGHKTELETLTRLMNESSYIMDGSTDSWHDALIDWLSNTTDPGILAMLDGNKYPLTDEYFVNLTHRLTTEQATRTASYVYFDTSTTNLSIKATRFPMFHIKTNNADEEWEVMNGVYDIVIRSGFASSDCFPYALIYATWETNAIVQTELYRNIGLAMLCVFIVSLFLIINFKTSLLVFICVVATLMNVAGTMRFWGLTIDTVTSTILILTVGLSVDFSAHIGHMFMSVKGTKDERVKETIAHIGPAVFYGGFSTFLAFVLLSGSDTYVFSTFFRLNFLTIMYGFFHGLVFLPVVLGLIGPDPYPSASIVYRKSKSDKVNGIGNSAFEEDENKPYKGTHVSVISVNSSDDKPRKESIIEMPGEGSSKTSPSKSKRNSIIPSSPGKSPDKNKRGSIMSTTITVKPSPKKSTENNINSSENPESDDKTSRSKSKRDSIVESPHRKSPDKLKRGSIISTIAVQQSPKKASIDNTRRRSISPEKSPNKTVVTVKPSPKKQIESKTTESKNSKLQTSSPIKSLTVENDTIFKVD